MLKGKTILLVDDDERNRFALSSVLKANKLTVITANDGIECLSKLKSHTNIDLILMDMMMPLMDGYQTSRALRRQPNFKNIPIIALTAQAMPGDKEKCLEAGVNDYCSKPVEIEVLIEKMKKLLVEHGS